MSYTAIGSLARNEVVEGLAVSSDGGWAQVRKASGVTGWASLKYLIKVTPLPPPDPGEILMIVTADTHNVRASPGTDASVVDQVHRGDKVTFLGASSSWEWVNIQTSRKIKGWCSSRYLMEQTDLFAPQEDYPATGLHRALTVAVFMREPPNSTSSPNVDLKFNRVVNVDSISPDGKWKHCTNAWGESGWYPIERLARLGSIAVQQAGVEVEKGIRAYYGGLLNIGQERYIKERNMLLEGANNPLVTTSWVMMGNLFNEIKSTWFKPQYLTSPQSAVITAAWNTIKDLRNAPMELRGMREELTKSLFSFTSSWESGDEMYKRIQAAALSTGEDKDRLNRKLLEAIDRQIAALENNTFGISDLLKALYNFGRVGAGAAGIKPPFPVNFFIEVKYGILASYHSCI